MKITRSDEHKPTLIRASQLKPLDCFIREDEINDDAPLIFLRIMDNDETGICCVPLGTWHDKATEAVDGLGECESLKPSEKVMVVDAELRYCFQ